MQSNSRRVALLTGITGQDGAYLAQFLMDKGYTVHGIKRRASRFNTQRIDHLYEDPHKEGRRLILHYGDLTDATNLIRIVQEVQPEVSFRELVREIVAYDLKASIRESICRRDGFPMPASCEAGM